MTDPPWEKGYTDLSTKTFGGPSVEIRELAVQMPRDATVLDMGCGEGRNALFLAKKGFDVTAVDISKSGIRKLRVLADSEGIKICTEVADMCRYSFSNEFDLIISHGCLHLVERTQWQQLINRFKTYTAPGGANVVAVFTDAIPPPADLAEHCHGLFEEGELFSLYSDWDIELQKSYTFEDEHPGSPRHMHPVNKIVARKPSSPGG
jgi:tellurite methyltransferase